MHKRCKWNFLWVILQHCHELKTLQHWEVRWLMNDKLECIWSSHGLRCYPSICLERTNKIKKSQLRKPAQYWKQSSPDCMTENIINTTTSMVSACNTDNTYIMMTETLAGRYMLGPRVILHSLLWWHDEVYDFKFQVYYFKTLYFFKWTKNVLINTEIKTILTTLLKFAWPKNVANASRFNTDNITANTDLVWHFNSKGIFFNSVTPTRRQTHTLCVCVCVCVCVSVCVCVCVRACVG